MLSIGAADWKFGDDRKRIREWIQSERKIQNKVSQKNQGSFGKKIDGGGRKIKDKCLEEMLLEWITLQRSKNLQVSQKLIQRKAGMYAEEKMQKKKLLASEGRLEKFMS